MKYMPILLVLLAFGQLAGTPPNPSTLTLLSFNIRYNNPQDGINAWPNRKALAADVFRKNEVDFAGLQEALIGQIEDLQAQLPDYAWIGLGRDDGKRKGEFSPIFYRKDRFEAMREGTFWLSETPTVAGSKSWDAAITRVATYGVFRDKRSGQRFFVINTHFDHKGEQSRQQSAKLLIKQIRKLSLGLPVVLTGDFNSPETSPALQTLTTDSFVPLRNARHHSHLPHAGGENTFNGWGKTPQPAPIDFILLGPGFRVQQHAYLPIMEKDVYVSDHWPVLARVEI